MIDPPYLGLDSETTGLHLENDRVVQLAVIPGGGQGPFEGSCHLVNPQRPIPPEATKIHGIRDQDVAEAPTFPELAPDLVRFADGRIIVGYNVRRFDVPLIRNELDRSGYFGWDPPVIDVCDFVSHHERGKPRKQPLVAQRRGIDVGRAHSAGDDVRTTLAILGAMQREGLIPEDMDEAVQMGREIAPALDAEFRRWAWYLYVRGDLVPRLGFGMYQGHALTEIATRRPDYLDKLLRKPAGELPPEVRRAFQDAIARRQIGYLLEPLPDGEKIYSF